MLLPARPKVRSQTIKRSLTILTVALLISECLIFCAKFSPHMMKNHAISLNSLSSSTASPAYTITMEIENVSDDFEFLIYCFKEKVTQLNADRQTCQLTDLNTTQRFMCVEQNYTRLVVFGVPLTLQVTHGGFSFLSGDSTSEMESNVTELGTLTNVTVQATNLTRTVTIQNNKAILDENKIYHMLTAASRAELFQGALSGQISESYKENYVHTYSHNSFFDTLIMQRHPYCLQHNNKVVHIFQGAVERDGFSHYFTGILTLTTDSQDFQMWGGYSYSSAHAGRDMMGYNTQTGDFFDLYSLFAAAPYEDIEANVNGEKNVVRVGNSGKSSIPTQVLTNNTVPYHFIQFYRLFDTSDVNGDEILREKIYNRFCYAAYFRNTSATNTSISVLSNSFKHELIDCHLPNLEIGEGRLSWVLFGKYGLSTVLVIVVLFSHF